MLRARQLIAALLLFPLGACGGQSFGGYPQPTSNDHAPHYDDAGLARAAHDAIVQQSSGASATVTAPRSPAPTVASLPKRKIAVASEPRNLILEEKLRRMLAGWGSIELVDEGADLVVVASDYVFNYDDTNSRSEHVAMGKYQIPNLVGAALLMPEAASYNVDIEHLSAQASWEFAYLVRLPSGRELAHGVISNKTEREAVRCSQPMIVNVFGGSTPARFWASDELQRLCENNDTGPTKASVEDFAESLIGNELQTKLGSIDIPAVAKSKVRKAHRKEAA